jgi:hypothetical protein
MTNDRFILLAHAREQSPSYQFPAIIYDAWCRDALRDASLTEEQHAWIRETQMILRQRPGAPLGVSTFY